MSRWICAGWVWRGGGGGLRLLVRLGGVRGGGIEGEGGGVTVGKEVVLPRFGFCQ